MLWVTWPLWGPEGKDLAKVTLGPMVGEASGKLGGMVFSHNRGGTYVRRRAKPVVVTSSAAEATKASFGAVSNAWAGLSQLLRDAWKTWAANNPRVDRLGNKITLDGHAAFVWCNSRQVAAGDSVLSLPPTVNAPDALSTLTLAGAAVSSALMVNFTPSQVASSQRLQIKAAIEASPGRNYVEDKLRVIGYTSAGLASQINIMTMLQARLGTVQNGDTVHLRVATYDGRSGLSSMPLSTAALISGLVP